MCSTLKFPSLPTTVMISKRTGAVSYTHLDVYKRQDVYSVIKCQYVSPYQC